MSVEIAVCGYLSLDQIIVRHAVYEDVPGGVVYAALGAVCTGANVGLLATAGHDFLEEALSGLSRRGVNISHLARSSKPSRRARIQHEARGHRVSRSYSDPEWLARTLDLKPPPIPATWGSRVVVLSPMPADCVADYLCQAASLGARVVADTSEYYARAEGEALLALLGQIDLFAPSREETRLLLPGRDDDAALRELFRRSRGMVVQKRGSDGLRLMSVAYPQGLSMAAQMGDVVDPTGAGDACVGALAAGLAKGLPQPEMLQQACRIAALAISAVGPANLGLN